METETASIRRYSVAVWPFLDRRTSFKNFMSLLYPKFPLCRKTGPKVPGCGTGKGPNTRTP